MANGDELMRNVGLDEENDIAPAERSFGGKKYLLSIGINYTGSVPAVTILNKAENDANAFADELEKNYGFEPANVTRLIGQNADFDAILGIVDKYEPLSKEDSLVVFFAGHGIDNFWIPFNGDVTKKNSTCIPMSTIANAFFGYQCAQVLVIVDCCFAGNIAARATMETLFNKEADKSKHFYVLTSSTDQTTKDSSPFFQYLMQLLQEKELNSFSDLYSLMLHNDEIKSFISKSDPGNASLPFVLMKNDKIKPELKKAFLDLNFDKQKNLLATPVFTKFNLIYLHGTPLCAHHLAIRFMVLNKIKNGDKELPFIMKKFRADQNEAVVNNENTLWDKLIGNSTNNNQFGKCIQDLIEGSSRIFIVSLEKNHEKFSADMIEFWTEIDEAIKNNKVQIKNPQTKFYFIIVDRGGKSGMLNLSKLESISANNDALEVFDLGSIELLDAKKLRDWRSQSFSEETFELFISSNRFLNFIDNPFDNFSQEEYFVAGSISKICTDVNYSDLANEILLKN